MKTRCNMDYKNIKTIEECCKMIRAQSRLLGKHIGNSEHIFVDSFVGLADRILELYKNRS